MMTQRKQKQCTEFAFTKKANFLVAPKSPMIFKDFIQKHPTKVYTTDMIDQIQLAKQTKLCKMT